MSERGWFPFYPAAYLQDTDHLTLEEHGAYLMLLMKSWRMPDCEIPDDPIRIARMLRIDPRMWKRLAPVILPFFPVTRPGFRANYRLRSERSSADLRQKSARSAAYIRHQKNDKPLETNDPVDANAHADSMPRARVDNNNNKESPKSPRAEGTSLNGFFEEGEPRMNPRAEGTNPRALGTNPRALKNRIVDPPYPQTAIEIGDPRWGALAQRWKAEKGKTPPLSAGRWWFPSEWIVDNSAKT